MRSYQEDCGTITIKTLFTRLQEKGKCVALVLVLTLISIFIRIISNDKDVRIFYSLGTCIDSFATFMVC